MQRNYNVNISRKYGIYAAIILENIMYWVQLNKAEGRNFFEGRFWTFNSIKALEKYFPDMTSNQIRYALDKLIKEGLILSANFNQGCSRTLWYTYTQKALALTKTIEPLEEIDATEGLEPNNTPAKKLEKDVSLQTDVEKSPNSNVEIHNTICENSQIDLGKSSNGTNNKPQIINTNKKQAKEREINKEKEQRLCLSLIDFWNSQGLLECESLTSELEEVILSCLKVYTFEQLCEYICNYATVVYAKNNGYWWTYKWDIKTFLSKQEALQGFANNGRHWLAYKFWLQSRLPPQPPEARMLRNNLTKEQISALMSDLDSVVI